MYDIILASRRSRFH